jgi:hypothetical protein
MELTFSQFSVLLLRNGSRKVESSRADVQIDLFLGRKKNLTNKQTGKEEKLN